MVTVLLVRHADVGKTIGAPKSEPLNENGRRRAETLVGLAGALRVAAIFKSNAARTEETAQPLATKLHLTMQNAPAPAELAATIASGTLGAVVLVVGHSDTVPKTVAAFLGKAIPTIPHAEFDNL